jgi:RHH-type transcriptional regulator, proline utilization regulon repressor / proline dehydrogenase / delta 1-pyrroline-5-carboxylate dehydrogenase
MAKSAVAMDRPPVSGGGARPTLPDRDEIAAYHLHDERKLVGALIERATFTEDERRRIHETAKSFVLSARANTAKFGGIDAFMHEYGLTSEEGVILMCLAEALLRIPDKETADALIAEKIGEGQWDKHFGASGSLFVNASTFGLMLTGRVVRLGGRRSSGPLSALQRLVARTGEPVIRQALRQAMRILGDNFVLGRDIKEALSRASSLERKGYRFSYDMLGEGAKTFADATRYYDRYRDALAAVGAAAGKIKSTHVEALMQRPSLSVKLSALHPRFEDGKREDLYQTLRPRLLDLAVAARDLDIPLTIDAEEQDRLDIQLEMFGSVCADPALQGWHGLGIAVQGYGRRSIPVLRWLRRVASMTGKRIPVRLVKGAYWDSEIKWAQERGYPDYPVFTRKLYTDVSYLAGMRLLLSDPAAFYPQFASHNAHTVASALASAGNITYEFQRLHGMGEALYEDIVASDKHNRPCRIYAPVGGHEDLLAYLVRRLLENGANTSFVNRLADEDTDVSEIIRDPVQAAGKALASRSEHVAVPKPVDLYANDEAAPRKNSLGIALSNPATRADTVDRITELLAPSFAVGPIIAGKSRVGGDTATLVRCPHDRRMRIGTVIASTTDDIDRAYSAAQKAAHGWDRLGGDKRAEILERAAALFERDRLRLMAAIVREAGKTLENAIADVREAVDFLRYYALEARRLFVRSTTFIGATGERNTLELRARGPIVAISPWNFPLAIFAGQVAAALAAGNPVLAKPAPQTPITAFLAVELLHEAGVPPEILHLLPGGGAIGSAMVRDRRCAGVVFTGSNETAWAIQRTLADRRAAVVPFIAETGGINAMIVDSSALSEQVVRDAVQSAFDSAGQRCSAARILYVQRDVSDRIIEMLVGATQTLTLGDPMDDGTDIGPVIDEVAQDRLDAHKLAMKRSREAAELIDLPLPDQCRAGTYVTPAIYEIAGMAALEREVFGPILHVVRYDRGHLDKVIDDINDSGFGLTLGLHSRITAVADFVAETARVGNLYVNRNQIGAVVGVQPFGGEGLSGSGPKAGGPRYVERFATERVRTTDITSAGGNVQLLGLDSD